MISSIRNRKCEMRINMISRTRRQCTILQRISASFVCRREREQSHRYGMKTLIILVMHTQHLNRLLHCPLPRPHALSHTHTHTIFLCHSLLLAFSSLDHGNVTKLLITYGANVNAKNILGITPRDLAILNEGEKIN